MKKIDSNEIDFNLEYEGYFWYSDAKEPQIFENQHIKEALFTKLPFVVEGYLYNRSKRVSLKIKYFDGENHFYQVHLEEFHEDQVSPTSFAAQKVKGLVKRKIQAVQYWEEAIDPLCEGMAVLKPSWIAFTGFDHELKAQK